MKEKQNHFLNICIRLIIVFLITITSLGNYPNRPATAAPPTRIFVDQNASGGNDGSTWTNAFVYLQDALDLANSSATPDYEIWVAEGVYYPDKDMDGDHTADDTSEIFLISYDNVRLFGGFSGVETSLDQRDWVKNMVILSGDIDNNDTNLDGNNISEDWNDIVGSNAERVFLINSSINEPITLATIIDGFLITGADSASLFGGGLYCYAGGSVGHSGCSATLRNLRIQGNKAAIGGGLMVSAAFDADSYPYIVNVVLEGNYANNAGGGMAVHATATSDANANPVLVNVKFRNNYSAGDGGGITFYSHVGLIDASLTNVEFIGNITDGKGGGIEAYVDEGSLEVEINNITSYDNSANKGGTLYTAKHSTGVLTMEINNSIFWGNTSTSIVPEIENLGSTPSFEHSDIQGCGGSSSWDSLCGTDGGGNIDATPLFKSLGTGDLALKSGSPARDTGDETLLPMDTADLDQDGNSGEDIPLDLNNFPRIQGSDVDMGAYEYGEHLINVGFYAPNKLKWYLKHDKTDGWTGVTNFRFGGAVEFQAVTGDWNGDGVDTGGFYMPSSGKWYLKNTQVSGWSDYIVVRFAGASGAEPVTGDWDNNGVDTPGFYLPSQGKWFLKNNLIDGWNDYIAFKFAGASGAQPVAGDWNGDGYDTVGLYIPSAGKWYLKHDRINGWKDYTAVRFAGASGAVAVVGDWSGDGEDGLGFHLPIPKKWFLKDDLVHGWSGVTAFKFGGPSGWQPVTGDWTD